MTLPTSASVLRSYYALAGLYTLAASVIWGVNTLFMLEAGLSIAEVFIANAAFSAGMVIFEIPTGVVADTVGRRASFLLSVGVLAVTTLLYVGLARADAGLLAWSGVSVLMGLGFTFYSGAVEAWLVDALSASGHEGGLDEVFARGQMITGVAMLIGSVGGGFLGQIDLAIPYLVRAAMLIALFGLAFDRMHDVGFTPQRVALGRLPGEMKRIAASGIAYGWKQQPLRLLMIVALLQAGFLYWAFYAWQPYFLDLLGRDAVWVAGVVSALISMSTIAGNFVVEWFTRFCGRRTTLLLWAAGAQTVGAVIVGLTSSFWIAVAALLLVTAGMGVAMPVRQAYLHHIIESDQRATVVSFDSMVAGVGGTGSQIGLGALAEAQSFSAGYIVGGGVTVLALPLLARVRRLHDEADLIVGRKAAADGTGAAEGLPLVAAVESHARETVTTGS